jgi:hypothetical protein
MDESIPFRKKYMSLESVVTPQIRKEHKSECNPIYDINFNSKANFLARCSRAYPLYPAARASTAEKKGATAVSLPAPSEREISTEGVSRSPPFQAEKRSERPARARLTAVTDAPSEDLL